MYQELDLVTNQKQIILAIKWNILLLIKDMVSEVSVTRMNSFHWLPSGLNNLQLELDNIPLCIYHKFDI